MYYRVAIQADPSSLWQWKSTVLSELSALFQFLRLYRALGYDCLHVFSSSSHEEMNEQLVRENQGLEFTSVTAAQFLQQRRLCVSERAGEGSGCEEQERVLLAVAPKASSYESYKGAFYLDARGMSPQERRRREIEGGAGGDHDRPYRFTLPDSVSQIHAWIQLLVRFQDGAFQP